MPYLQRIDANRHYSNRGPLVVALERRLQPLMGLAEHQIVPCSSGTSALLGALLAVAGDLRETAPLCLVPAFSFAATVAAVRLAGFLPHLVASGPDGITLCPEALRAHPRLNEVRAVVPVAPFGRALDLEAWARFARNTGINVIIDAAAGFEWLTAPEVTIPEPLVIAVSLHATKAFSCGEGGLILATNPDSARRCLQAINHGFFGAREAKILATNGKMSEYHAAVALAELDGWPEKRAGFLRAAGYLRAAWNEAPRDGRLWTAPEVAGCYTLYQAPNAAAAEAAQTALAAQGIETRFWYGQGLQAHLANQSLDRDALECSAAEAGRWLGLPAYLGMTREEATGIVQALP